MPGLAEIGIDLAEASYDLGVDAADWLPHVMRAGEPAFGFGTGMVGLLGVGFTSDGQPLVAQLCTLDGSTELPLALLAAAQEIGEEQVRRRSELAMRGPTIETLWELHDAEPELYEPFCRHLGCKDALLIHAHDPNGHGVLFTIPTTERIHLSPAVRHQWERIAVHIATGSRLRLNLNEARASGAAPREIPLEAEALLDPARFLVSHAVGEAKDSQVAETIRRAALQVDHARGKMRKEDPEQALRLWRGMVEGRWSLVDWFDTDGRRFVLAKPNAPHFGDPRGLTAREHQVVTYAAHGDSSKLICYRLGISPQRVSKLLHDGMRKLGVKTKAQLIEKLRGLPTDASLTD